MRGGPTQGWRKKPNFLMNNRGGRKKNGRRGEVPGESLKDLYLERKKVVLSDNIR